MESTQFQLTRSDGCQQFAHVTAAGSPPDGALLVAVGVGVGDREAEALADGAEVADGEALGVVGAGLGLVGSLGVALAGGISDDSFNRTAA